MTNVHGFSDSQESAILDEATMRELQSEMWVGPMKLRYKRISYDPSSLSEYSPKLEIFTKIIEIVRLYYEIASNAR